MVEDKLINTRTQVNVSTSLIDIFIYYVQKASKLINFFISDVEKTVGGVNFKQGELGYSFENTNDLFTKNSDGQLVVSSTESEQYSINPDGQLIYVE